VRTRDAAPQRCTAVIFRVRRRARSGISQRMAADVSAEWCAASFGLGEPRQALQFMARGQTNPLGVFRLETQHGSFAVKNLGARLSAGAVLIERAAHAAGVPMPEPLRSITGEVCLRAPDAGRELWIRIYPWIDGEPGRWGVCAEEASHAVGVLMARVHGLRVPPEALEAVAWEPPGETGWRELAAAARARGLSWAEGLLEKLTVLLSLEDEARAAARREVTPSQRDYHPPNIIQRVDGERVLVDWDAAGPCDARREVILFALRWAGAIGAEPQRELVQALVRGYVAGGAAFPSPSLEEVRAALLPNLWWLWFNVERDVGSAPGADDWLVPALLSQVELPDPALVQRRRALFL